MEQNEEGVHIDIDGVLVRIHNVEFLGNEGHTPKFHVSYDVLTESLFDRQDLEDKISEFIMNAITDMVDNKKAVMFEEND